MEAEKLYYIVEKEIAEIYSNIPDGNKKKLPGKFTIISSNKNSSFYYVLFENKTADFHFSYLNWVHDNAQKEIPETNSFNVLNKEFIKSRAKIYIDICQEYDKKAKELLGSNDPVHIVFVPFPFRYENPYKKESDKLLIDIYNLYIKRCEENFQKLCDNSIHILDKNLNLMHDLYCHLESFDYQCNDWLEKYKEDMNNNDKLDPENDSSVEVVEEMNAKDGIL